MTPKFYGKDLAQYKLERAREELDTAQLLLDNQKLKAANNRAYYSIAYFNKNYVHTGIFSREIGRAIAKVAKVRHASDYDEFYIAGREEAEKQIQTANDLITAVEDYIEKNA